LQFKIADQITKTRDGKSFVRGGLIPERCRLEIFTGDFRFDLDLQYGRVGIHREQKQQTKNDVPSTVHFIS
jgi:hypothetical protein